MKYELIFEKQVKKFIEKQDKPFKQRLKKAFSKLRENPYLNNRYKKTPKQRKLSIKNRKIQIYI